MYRLLIESTEENLYSIVVAEFGHNIVDECAIQCGYPGLTVVKWVKLDTTENLEDAAVIDFFTGRRVA